MRNVAFAVITEREGQKCVIAYLLKIQKALVTLLRYETLRVLLTPVIKIPCKSVLQCYHESYQLRLKFCPHVVYFVVAGRI